MGVFQQPAEVPYRNPDKSIDTWRLTNETRE
jgi:hypothetical protein